MTPAQIHKKEELDLLPEALKILRGYGLEAEIDKKHPAIGKTQVDAVMRLRKGNQVTLYAAEVKPQMNAATLGTMLQKKQLMPQATLLVTNHVTREFAEKLKANQIAFVDLAGNTWLQGPNFLLWVTGHPPRTPIRTARAARAFQQGGLQLIFALLTNPQWVDLPYRTLAEKIGIANGTVAAALNDLELQGFVLRAKGRRATRRLRNKRRLLEKWTEGYIQKLYPTTAIGKYQTHNNDTQWWRNIDIAHYHALLGGEAAGALLTEFLTPGMVTIYMNGPPGPLLLDCRLRPAPDGQIIIREKFWTFEPENWEHPKLTPPILIYADLLATGDARCIETANRIYDGNIIGLLGEE